jgi:hypothetical protein
MTENDEDKPRKLALFEIRDVLGLSGPGKRLVDAIARGIGELARPAQHTRLAKAEQETAGEWIKKLEESGVRVESGVLDLAERARLRITLEGFRHQANREAIAAAAAEDFIDANPNEFAEVDVEEEWIDRYWRLAQDISRSEMQLLWGRLLSRQMSGREAYSPRCLEALTLLTKNEMEAIEYIASVRFVAETGKAPPVAGVIASVSHISRQDRDATNASKNLSASLQYSYHGILGSIGLMHDPAGWADTFRAKTLLDEVPMKIGNRLFVLRNNNNTRITSHHAQGNTVLGGGRSLTPLGIEMTSLVDTPPDTKYLAALTAAYSAIGLTLEPR